MVMGSLLFHSHFHADLCRPINIAGFGSTGGFAATAADADEDETAIATAAEHGDKTTWVLGT